MAQIEILVDREDGSRFALNYNKQTTGNLFRYARAERLFGKEEELRWRYESEYEDFFENFMATKPKEEGGERINCDFFVDDTKSINLNLSSGKCMHKTQLKPPCLQEEKILFLRSYGTLFILLNTFFLTFSPSAKISSYGSLISRIYIRSIFWMDKRSAVLLPEG